MTRLACWVPAAQRSPRVLVARIPKIALLDGVVTGIAGDCPPPPRYLVLGIARLAWLIPAALRSPGILVASVANTQVLDGQATQIALRDPPPCHIARGITLVCWDPLMAARSVSRFVASAWKIMLFPLVVRIAVWQ